MVEAEAIYVVADNSFALIVLITKPVELADKPVNPASLNKTVLDYFLKPVSVCFLKYFQL